MNGLWQLARAETRLFFRERQAVFWTFLFPLLMIWLFGEIFGSQKVDGLTYSDAYIPSWLAVNLLTTALFTIGSTLTSYRQIGVLRRLQATPLRARTVMTAHMAYGLVVFVMSAVIVVAFGALAFHLQAPKYLWGTILATVLSIVALFPFGLLMTCFARNARTSAAISSVLLNLMLFLSGATFPLSMMPSFLQHVARILPLYYVIDLLRETWSIRPFVRNVSDIVFLCSLSVLSILLSARFFRWSANPE